MGTVKSRVLKPKVTVESVRRKWEEKYAQLNKKHEALCAAHMDLARAADLHRTAQEHFREEMEKAQDLATDRLIRTHQLQGVIIYLEGKLNGSADNSV